jgi:hypothetical protein
LRTQHTTVSGLRQASPTPSAGIAPPTEGLHATERGTDATPPPAESVPPRGIQGASMATAQSTPPARHVMPRLRAKERLAACCGGLAACCGCKALPADQLPPKPPTDWRPLGPTIGRPPPAPATDRLPPKPPTGRRPLGPTAGRPPPASATDRLPPKPPTGRRSLGSTADRPPPASATDRLPPKPPTGRRSLGSTAGRPPPASATDLLPPKPPTGRRSLGSTAGRPPPAPAADQPLPVRGTPISAGACGIIFPEYLTERLEAARTEARKARRMQMAKRVRGKTQISLPTSREAGALSETEIIAVLARATPVIGLPGSRR